MKLNLALVFCTLWLLASCASNSDNVASRAVTATSASAPITLSAQDAHIALMGRTRANSDGSRSSGYPGVSYFLTATGTNMSMIASSNEIRIQRGRRDTTFRRDFFRPRLRRLTM